LLSEDEFVTENQVLDDTVTALNNMGMTSASTPGEPVSAADNKYINGHAYFYHSVDDSEIFENELLLEVARLAE
jgi:hypothetical protein